MFFYISPSFDWKPCIFSKKLLRNACDDVSCRYFMSWNFHIHNCNLIPLLSVLFWKQYSEHILSPFSQILLAISFFFFFDHDQIRFMKIDSISVSKCFKIKNLVVERNYSLAICHSPIQTVYLTYTFLFISELKNTIETQVNELKSQIESKCVMQWIMNISKAFSSALTTLRNPNINRLI